ncbi:flavin-binding monooxygenase [Mesorhizobium sp. 113-3-9]|uniref:flavin-containing monooxygenase n=1 Tax=Mesorhizobium sp. 113-3-9 TaxID=2744517 RepID=UPI00192866B5|nr:NAD(P)/FAD-dependent oxidoreductase [Mesorhizobium sp. 113-3-9]BCG86697.1 flavin-binding monooxygenase [Mesorhizobium sp. 113-3-9]
MDDRKSLQSQPLSVAIAGAGAGGLCMAIRLKQAGIPFIVFEKADRVGGTWRDNDYPGSGCDIVSHLYSFSFEMNPDWSRRFAKQDEIQAYFERIVEKYGLGPSIHLSTELSSAEFDETASVWRLRTAAGEEYQANCLVTATGQLNLPATPAFPGLESFGGPIFHSARWDHGIDLEGKRVAVIGSGASAIQFLPEIAPKASKLTLFQRSPNWVIPKPDRAISPFEKRMLRAFPWLMKVQRLFDYWSIEQTFRAFLKGSRLGLAWQKQSQRSLEEAVKDPELRSALTPDYPAGCKRILLSNEWFKTLARPNVELVRSGIEGLDQAGIRTGGGHRNADVIILATGFETQRFLAPMTIKGLGGLDLHEAWAGGATAHRGITLTGFPNLFMLYGPNTNLGHGSAIFMLECQVLYVMRCLKAMQARRTRFMAPRKAAMERFNKKLDVDLQRTVWAAGCSSWYKDASGRILNNWSGSTVRYWWETLWVRPDEYDFVRPSRLAAGG